MFGLSLFSGIGALDVALSERVRTIAYCENDRFCQAVLLSKMSIKQLPIAPIWDDVTTLSSAYLPGVGIIYGGFPCQDISCAGNGMGLEGKRSGLYWEMHRLCKDFRPTFIFIENVPAITTRGGLAVVESLTEIGYDCRWTVLSAKDCGAPHKRERWWLLAHSKGERCEITRRNVRADEEVPRPPDYDWWKSEPRISRVDDGTPLRVDRVRALGNAVVPQCAKKAFETLMGLR